MAAIEFGVEFLLNATRGQRQVIAAPTGSGKSFVELKILERLGGDAWLLTPRLEIARGLAEKAGLAPATSLADLVNKLWSINVSTPIRFRNKLLQGELPRVSKLIVDEGHHATASSYEDIQGLCGLPPTLLLTATPYRGTSRGTQRFIEEWATPNEIVWMVTMREAAERGYVSIPTCTTIPLLDDDMIEVTSTGEFCVKSAASAFSTRVDDLAGRCIELGWWNGESWGRPTIFALPSTQCCAALCSALARRGALCLPVTAGTRDSVRRDTFAMLRSAAAAVAQVAVLGEGVDLPVRRLVDASPKLSPVAAMQLWGRATRPCIDEPPPEIFSCCRNLQRHAYLWDGLLPPAVVAQAELAFSGPGKRGGHRALGFEALGRFKAAEVRCLDSTTALMYLLWTNQGGRAREISCILHPCSPDPVWAERVRGRKPDGTVDYGRWVKLDKPPDSVQGFSSVAPREPSEKMMAWFKRSAATRGLDPDQKVTRKNFAVLPILLDIGARFPCAKEVLS